MKHFLWNHKASILTAQPQAFQTLLPITNVEEPKICLKQNIGLGYFTPTAQA
jgi:hypothetical protein